MDLPDGDRGTPRPGLVAWFTESQMWNSLFRHGPPDSGRNRALVILSNVFLHLHPVRVRRHALSLGYTWCMGGLSTFLFLALTATGTLLMFYYHPDKLNAYRDLKSLEHDVPFGILLRNSHRWAGHLMVVTVMLHMLRVFLTGSYKPPREFNWVVGVALLGLTMLLSFSGYLLTDDQLGYWAVTVGTNLARATPGIGHEGPLASRLGVTPYNDLGYALLGGPTVGPNALLRAYVWHCVALPLMAVILMAVHFWRVRRDGGISGPL
jgi:quinol-cytochrome oxidoreductase complex cytochrome b subunit